MSETWSTTEDATRRQYLEVVSRQSDYLSRLDLLMATLSDVGGLEPDSELVDLSEMTRGIVDDLGNPEGVRCRADATVKALADPDQCERIIRNLLDNALAHGATPVDVVIESIPQGAQIAVRDHGPGVPERLVGRMFEAFARADGPNRRRRGTGLGLSIVRGLARANGGDVWYERADPGARFVVRLPIAPQHASAPDTGTIS